MKRIYSFLLVALFCSLPFIYGKLVEQAKFLDHRSETRVAAVEVDLSTPAAFSNTLMTCDGGMVSTSSGADTTYVCYDGTDQIIAFDSTNTSMDNFQYVVTDANGVILGLPPADMVNFTAAGPGECWVWGLSYTGNLTAMVGDTATSINLSDDCFDLSDNFVVVLRDTVSGGIVSSAFGTDTVNVCIDDATAAISFNSTDAVGPNFRYVVTDANGVILGLPPANMVDFSGAGIGECWVWGLSYSGMLTAQLGDTATAVDLTDGCFDLSDNFVVVLRDSMPIDGGRVYTESQMDTVYVCYDGSQQVIAFDSSMTSGPNFQYVVTDANGTILGLPPADMVDFTAAGPGECWVWGLSYSGNLTAQAGDNATQVALTDGCFELSENFVVVFRDSVSGGIVSSAFGTDTVHVCIDDATPAVSFSSMDAVGPNFRYVVTDDNGVILGLPPANTVDFSGAGIGECWVWGLSYSGMITAQVGDTATSVPLTDGCFDLSDNFVVVLRDSMQIDGGRVYTEALQDTVYVCYDGTQQVIAFDSSMTAGPNFQYVVTDANGTILGLPPADMVDFTAAGPGECWVWGLSYTGTITAQAGDNATQVALTDGCFELSENFVVVFRDSVNGGMVSTAMGEDTVSVCIDDNTAAIEFASMNATGENFQYVVTDNNGIILGLPPANMVDFSGAGIGECWVWGLSYTGNLTAMTGQDATQIDFSDGCFDLSDNFVVVFRDSIPVDGGMVLTESGKDTTYICYDGTPQVIAFDSAGTAGPNFQYVVTDANGTILGLPPADMVDFTAAGPGECWVWGLSYTGTITAMAGDNATQVALSDGCFELSENFVVVFRDSVSGGMVSSAFGQDTVNVCIDDSTPAVAFASTDAVGMNFSYVVTDANGVILGLPPANMVDFSGAGIGECWVWGLSYSGEITAQLGDTATAVDLASGCFDLSDNFVVVLRDSMEIDGGMVLAQSGVDTVEVCIDGSAQLVRFDSTGTSGANFQYVVTDASGKILGLPPGDQVDFGPAGVGECWVWGLSYTGNLTAAVDDNALEVALSDGCFELSESFLVVLRDSSFCNVGIEDELGLEDFKIYPNPTTDKVVVSFLSIQPIREDVELRVYDLKGQLLDSRSVAPTGSSSFEAEVDLSRFEDGLYLIQIQNNQGVYHQKVIKR
ncbi:MAG: T9SS type A sorting domain-containing protein [Bacteroidia bacterium]|nr:T9SS type A sorting domain-containing protein [Bacteroidia bacterium]